MTLLVGTAVKIYLILDLILEYWTIQVKLLLYYQWIGLHLVDGTHFILWFDKFHPSQLLADFICRLTCLSSRLSCVYGQTDNSWRGRDGWIDAQCNVVKLPQLCTKSGFSLLCWDGGGGGGGMCCLMLLSWSSNVKMVALMKQPNIPNPNTTYIILFEMKVEVISSDVIIYIGEE